MTETSSGGFTRRGLLGMFAATLVTAAPTYSNAAGFLRGGGDIRRIRMQSGRTGERIDMIYWIEGDYIKDAVREVNHYEHCNYFSAGSLARLFRSQGFSVEAVGRDYDDQYLMVDCRPSNGNEAAALLPQEHDMEQLEQLVSEFSEQLPRALDGWRSKIAKYRQDGERVVIWGAGSKGVAFLTTLGLGEDAVEFAVDINPHRHGQFMATTGQEIIGPKRLKQDEPDVVIVMNPIYKQEIEADLEKLGLTPEVLTT